MSASYKINFKLQKNNSLLLGLPVLSFPAWTGVGFWGRMGAGDP